MDRFAEFAAAFKNTILSLLWREKVRERENLKTLLKLGANVKLLGLLPSWIFPNFTDL